MTTNFPVTLYIGYKINIFIFIHHTLVEKQTQYYTMNLTNKELTWHNSGNSFENIYTSQYHHKFDIADSDDS